MSDELNQDGQPIPQGYNWQRIKDSRMDELIGICRGILADGVVVIEEARFLLDWLTRNKQVRHSLPGQLLEELLVRVLADGKLSPSEEEQVVEMLVKIIGGTPLESEDASFSTTLPLDDPPRAMAFDGKVFCFTGKFQYGSRKKCEEDTFALGGDAQKTPTKKTDYLVIGEIGSSDWAHSTGGRKIEKAIALRDSGTGLCIVSEMHWCNALADAM